VARAPLQLASAWEVKVTVAVPSAATVAGDAVSWMGPTGVVVPAPTNTGSVLDAWHVLESVVV
jgi:hypothetical protein